MIHRQLLLLLSAGFVLATIAGTLLHELGHFAVAESLGFDAEINYRSTYFVINENWRKKSDTEKFLITLGGPLQTVLTGSVGLLLLFLFKKSFKKNLPLRFGQWILVFITLFWLRQPFNLFMRLFELLVNRKISGKNDETKISRYLELSDSTILIVSGCTGLIFLVIVFFRFIPKNQRLTFLLSGLIGGIAGYLIWFEWLGKIIMP